VTLTLGEAAVTLREAVKDRAYRATPLGLLVARYVRWKRNEWGATPETIRDYEAILARLALFFADLDAAGFEPPVGTERLRECWDHYWGEKSPRTRAKVRSVWVDFFKWLVDEKLLYGNPALALTRPRTRGVKRDPFPADFVPRVIGAQGYAADRLGCRLILEFALRRGELIGLRFGDFDPDREGLTVYGKGGKFRRVSVPKEDPLWMELERFRLEIGGDQGTYILYRTDTRRVFCSEAEATEQLQVAGRMNFYRWRTVHNHSRAVSGKTAHQWWARCLERAGYTETKGMNMHRGRHTVATEILRKSGNLAAAQEMLGHKDPDTTLLAYAQFNDADMLSVLRQIRDSGR
jgi:integrase